MIVYDVVQIIEPGTQTSTPTGRWFVDGYGDEREAWSMAERCNERALVNGIKYKVETHDDECPGRAVMYGEKDKNVKSGACVCKGCRIDWLRASK